jgi:transcriptional regulator of acetoin/glycerol metabolism
MSVLNPYLYAYNPDLLACENAWVKFIRDNEFLNNDVISKEIRESWDYCKNNNIEALSRETIPLLSKEELADRIRSNKEILEIVSPFLITLFEIVEHSGFRVDFVDVQGCILKSFSDKSINELIQKTQSCEGAIRCEEKAGTNAIALALKTKKPIQISGGEHYMQQFHRWSCSAAPIMDEKGKVFGVVNMAGRYEGVHKHTLALVAYVAKAIENAIQVQKINEELKMSNEQLNTILGGVSDGIVYTKEDMIEGVNKEMCSFLGEKEENITGKYIEEAIHTTPNVKELIKSVKNNFQNREIILEGKNHALNCLVDIRNTYNQDGQKSGEIIIFTRVEEIQMMAKKIVNTPKYSFNDIIGTSAALKATIETAQRAAMYNSRVIIHGESGTGKEMLAQAIHNYSRRKYGSFIAVDCGAIPKELFESELFGYEEGSFTGAKAGGKTGLIELADKGTLFLDEIGNMPLDSQKKLLRALQEGTINKVGSNENIEVDIRVIAATNMDLLKAIEAGKFREDEV